MARTFRSRQHALGAPEDPVATNTSSPWSAMSLLKAIHGNIASIFSSLAGYALLAGRAGGQALIGGTGAADQLVLRSTAGVGTSDAIVLRTGNAVERLRIDTNGVATFSGREGAVTPTFNDTPVQVHVGSVTDAAMASFYWANDLTGPKDTFFKSRGSPNTYTIVQDDDILGACEFFGADGTDFAEGARIQAEVDGTPGANDMPARIVVRTSEDGSQTSRERVRIDSHGRVTLWGSETEGGSTFDPTFAGIPLQVHVGVANSANAEALLHWGNDANSAVLQFYKGRGGAVNTTTIVQDGDRIGGISFSAEDGSNNARTAAFIQARVDGTPGASDMPGRLMFFTTPDGSVTTAERLRIANGGNVYFPGVGTTASAANAFLDSGSTPANELLRSTSSIRYKREVEELDPACADALLGLRPVWYRSACKADRPDWSHYGLIAEEVAQIDPRLCHWGYAAEDWETIKAGEGDNKQGELRLKEGAQLKPEGVTYDRLPVLLLSIVQRQQKRIEALEAERRGRTHEHTRRD